jgi:hypothetical protein
MILRWVRASSVKEVPHFAENPDDDEGPNLANTRIDQIANLPTLCDGSTKYVEGGTEGTISLGSGADPNDLSTAGTYKDVGVSDTSVAFDVYVPMEGDSSASTSIFLALGFVVDEGADGTLDDTSADVGITAWVSSRPWWLASDGQDEVHTLLTPCSSPSASADPCVESVSGIFGAGGGRLDAGYSVELESILALEPGAPPSLEARLTLAPTVAIGSSGFSVPSGSIAKISVSWPTSGTFLGVNVGTGENELDFSISAADTPIKVDPKNTSSSSLINRWDIVSSDRVVTTLIGEARSTSSGISQDTWWPQCSVEITAGGAVNSDKCGAGMTSNVSDGYMVFSSVPAEVNLMINADAAPLAGGLVSTNGQGFAFGPETFSATAFQFAVSGPSFKADGTSRDLDGFYYVCIPETFLSGGFNTTSTAAAANWAGTRDGAASAGTAFTVGNCGVGVAGAGLVADLDPFGYSSPLFRLAPAPAAAAPASGGGSAALVAPVVASSSLTPLSPFRALDTRGSLKVGALDGSGAVRELTVGGVGGVPSSGVSAVAMNVTVVDGEASGGGYVTVFPCGVRPNASNLNFVSGDTVANSVIALVSSEGKVCFYVFGKAHLLADISGYWTSGFIDMSAPARLLDTRGSTKVGDLAGDGTVRQLTVIDSADVPPSGVSAVAMNVTVVDGEASGGGYVTVFPCGVRPNASNLNFVSGDTVANSVIAPVSSEGKVCFYVFGKAHLLADISGYFASASTESKGFSNSTSVARALDTRGSLKVGALDGSGAVRELTVGGVGGVPSSGVSAVAMNVTVVDGEASGGGYVTVFPCGVRPNASNLNFVSGDTVANSVIAPVSSEGKVCFYVFGKAHLLADISGYVTQ